MSWNVGQVAECISDNWGAAFELFPFLRLAKLPTVGDRSRVTGIPGSCSCGQCGVWLRLDGYDQNVAFFSTNFRPVVEDKPQVSEAYQMLLDAAQRATAPRREPVKT